MPVLSLAALEILDLHVALPRPQNPVRGSLSRTRRQIPASSDSATAASSTKTSSNQLPAPSALSQYSTTSTPKPGAVVTTYTKPTSSPKPGVGTAQDASSAEKGLDVKALAFGIIGSVLGLLLLFIIIYQLVRRHKRRSAATDGHEAFWEKWRWGVYSPVHGDVIYADHDPPVTAVIAGEGNQGKGPSGPWSRKFSVPRPLVGGGKGLMKKKIRAGTLYKVKRLKPGETFEIDSVGDLTTITSR